MSEAIAVGCLGIIGHLLGQPSRMSELTAESNEAQALELDDRPDFAEGTNLPQVATSQKQKYKNVGQRLEQPLLGSHSCPCTNTRGVRWLGV